MVWAAAEGCDPMTFLEKFLDRMAEFAFEFSIENRLFSLFMGVLASKMARPHLFILDP